MDVSPKSGEVITTYDGFSVYLWLSDIKLNFSEHLGPGLMLDRTSDGSPSGIEILRPQETIPHGLDPLKEFVSNDTIEQIRQWWESEVS